MFQQYLSYIQTHFQVKDLPEVIIWADEEAATRFIRECPIPAYTNDVRMVMTPDRQVWQDIYLKQLENYSVEDLSMIIRHYQSLSDNHLLQIVGHELVHQSELFLDYEEETMWFEEGMVEYISRRYFLREEEFAREKIVNQQLVTLFQGKYGYHSLLEFGRKTYEGDYASIFYEYWRSFLAIDSLVEKFGSIEEVFSEYHRWNNKKRPVDLLVWFEIER
ncbi:TPA: elongation factor Tu [Streptococcus suis]